jgi:hypothetical protein
MHTKNNSLISRVLLLFLFTTFGLRLPSSADTVNLDATKDNSIYSENNNSTGDGDLFSGRTQGRQGAGTRRALMQFDLTGSVPSGASIENVSITLNVSRRGPASVGSNVDVFLHRLIQDWGEGKSLGTGVGGSPSTGDVTWNFSFFNTENWQIEGGNFINTPSATQPMSSSGPITWSSSNLIADVQSWVDNPEQNFGWILLVEESAFGAATIFGSRENNSTGSRPKLTIDFSSGAEPPAVSDLVLEGLGDVVGEDIQHPSGNVFDQVLLAGQSVKLRAK